MLCSLLVQLLRPIEPGFMTLNFLPGQPNNTQQSTCQGTWQNHTILAYCSGNNLIVLTNKFTRLQTIYLPSDCVAVDINSFNGHIAVAVSNHVHVYKPLHQVMKNPKWVYCTKIYHDDSRVNTLKWGYKDELVLGSDYLSFWKIKDEFGEFKSHLLWTKRQPKPVYTCTISEDSQLIASIGKYDNNVKVWQRISIGGDQDIFDLSLLPHPQPVSTLRWKKNSDLCTREQGSHVLYSLCADGKLRIWTSYELDNKKTVQQWGALELDKTKGQRFCLILDSWIVQQLLSKKPSTNQFENYLGELKPDIVLFSNGTGDLDIYALENLSHDPPKLMGKKKLLSTSLSPPTFVCDPKFLCFAEPQLYDEEPDNISIVVHDLNGVIRHSLIKLSKLFDPRQRKIGALEHKLTGHNKSIQSLVRSSDGEAVLALTRFSENCVWVPQSLGKGVILRKKNVIFTDVPIKNAVVQEKGELVVTLLENFKLQIWKCPNEKLGKASKLCAEEQIASEKGYPLLILNTPEKKHHHHRHFVALIYASGEIDGFEVSFDHGIKNISSDSIDVGEEGHIFRVSAIDPVQRGFISDRSLISIVTRKGFIKTYKAVIDVPGRHIYWLKTFEVNTGFENVSHIRGSSIDKICIVDSTQKQMALWDLRKGVLEYEQVFDEPVKDIDWTSTEFGQSIVSIGFENYSLLFTQLRYDYTNKNPSYLPIEKIDIVQHTTHTIGDATWLKDGTFVVASGNQIFIKDKSLDLSDKFTHQSIGSRKILSNDILHLSSVLNGPLPIYHPQFLIQALFAKRLQLVREILVRLFLKMREMEFKSLDIKTIGSTLDMEPYKFLIADDGNYPVEKFEDPYSSFNNNVSVGLRDKLAKNALPYLTRHQQITLITVIEAMEEIDRNEKIVDINGIRFILGIKLFLSHKSTQASLTMRDISWALHSDNKEILLTMLNSSLKSWERAREYKISYWAKREDLVKKFEEIAKLEFTKDDKRNPSNCTIFYLALKKKHILVGLWRISSGHPDQQKLLKFLSNDFTEPRWRTAALKNAFVLLSKHRYMDAASFFLLADSLKDAVNVLVKQIKDLDLAIGICRVYEGDNGPVLDDLLTKQFLPQAVLDNDRWTSSFIYWKLKKQKLAIKALIKSPVDLEGNDKLVDRDMVINKSFLVEDPVLLLMYIQLRKRNINYLQGSLEIDEQLEYDVVGRVANIYTRMGCDYLALALVKNWEFIMINHSTKNSVEGLPAPTSVLDTSVPEPMTTKQVRPSLFDKFDSGTSDDYHTSPSLLNISKHKFETPSASETAPKSILDNFAFTSNHLQSQRPPKNLLDSFNPQKPPSAQPKNLLEEFSLQVPKFEADQACEKQRAQSQLISPSPEIQVNENSKETLDEFSKSKPTNGLPAKTKNLLDDFM